MQDFEIRALALANRLIAKYGQSIIWRQTSPVAGAQPWKPSGNTVVETPVIVCFLPSNLKTQYALQFLSTQGFPTGFSRGLMAGNVSFVPAVKDTIVRNSEVIEIKYCEAFDPAGNALLYTLGFEL